MTTAQWVNNLIKENISHREMAETMQQAAHDWKKRAKAAEKRCRELLTERNRMQDEQRDSMAHMTQLLTEAEKKLANTLAELREANVENSDLKLEINCLKAHAYDMAFGPVLEREG